jgi:putative membrane protein
LVLNERLSAVTLLGPPAGPWQSGGERRRRMIQIADLTHLNAALNGASIVLLGFGYRYIRTGRVAQHRACMLAAATVSAAFLVSYLIYHFNAGLAKFGGEGIIRPIYFGILFVHVAAAVAITPLVPITLWRALSRRFDRHRRIARWTWPLWMYVGVSGVVVYIMAVHLFPYAGVLRAG